MSREAKGTLKLTRFGRFYDVRMRVEAEGPRGVVVLEADRLDCQPSPVVRMPLDEAQAFLRQLQSACDQAARLAHQAHKASQRRCPHCNGAGFVLVDDGLELPYEARCPGRCPTPEEREEAGA